jgi:hypothetical protein
MKLRSLVYCDVQLVLRLNKAQSSTCNICTWTKFTFSLWPNCLSQLAIRPYKRCKKRNFNILLWNKRNTHLQHIPSLPLLHEHCRDSAIGMATGYGLDDRRVGVPVPVGSRIFLLSTSSRPVLGSTQYPIQWIPGALSSGVKQPGREIDNSPQTSAEVKKMWIYTSTPPYAFMA